MMYALFYRQAEGKSTLGKPMGYYSRLSVQHFNKLSMHESIGFFRIAALSDERIKGNA